MSRDALEPKRMIEQQSLLPSGLTSGADGKTNQWRRAIGYATSLVVLGSLSLMAGFEAARRTLPAQSFEVGGAAKNISHGVRPIQPIPASKGPDTNLDRLPPQQQVERLLQLSMENDAASLDLLREKVDGWRGHLKNTDDLFDLVLAALNSRDLRVRTVAVDVDLAANNLGKSPESVSKLIRELRSDPASRGMALWRLGSLGNRGVEPDRVLGSLLNYAHNPDEHTRYWAVEGLAMLGNDSTINPLLDLLAHDPSPKVRERAASSLGQSGLLTREERLAAVPHLLNLADDDSLNRTTRELVYGTLRVITGAALGNDAGSWREWWANHDPARPRQRDRSGLVRA
ncbi:MAG: HEAT repeat domain-containing protein [Candidatus Acidiferrum sp.]